MAEVLKLSGGYLGKTPVLGCIAKGRAAQLRRIPGAAINSERGVCYFPVYPPFHKNLLADIEAVFGSYEMSPNAEKLMEDAFAQEELFKQGVLDRPGFSFKTKPFLHQKVSLIDLIYHPRKGLLLDCGLGKSKIAIDLINYTGEKTLIVVPATLITNWVAEFEVHSFKTLNIVTANHYDPNKKKEALGIFDTMESNPMLDEAGEPVLTGKGNPRMEYTLVERVLKPVDADVVIVSYDIAAAYYEEIAKTFKFSSIILDESHRIKNVKSARTKALLELSQHCHRRVLMSGTMALNSPEDLYSQMSFLSPQILSRDYYTFRKDYIEFAKWNPKIAVGVKNLHKLNKKIRKHTIRYTKEECLDLPKRHLANRYFDLGPSQKKLYEEILSDEDLYIDGGVISKDHKIVAMQKLSQITGGFLYIGMKDPRICDGCPNMTVCVDTGVKPYTKSCSVVQVAPKKKTKRLADNPKLELCKELVEDILADAGNKILIWAKAIEELEMLEEALKKMKVKYVRIKDDPKTDVEPFENDDDVRVCLGNISMGIGFTANSANYTIYYSLSFNLEHYKQSIDRNYRIGQDKVVTVYHLIARDSIDERVMKAIENKEDIVESLLNNMECNRCKHSKRCLEAGIRQYGAGCIYQKKVSTIGEKL